MESAMFIHCPKCKSAATVPIIYGKPMHDAMEAAKHGLAHLAGCSIEDDRIDRHCKVCGNEWASHTSIDHHKEMVIMLDQLERELRQSQQNLEQACMDMGRLSIHGEAPAFSSIVHATYEYHEAWRDFTFRLHQFNGKVLIKDPKGGIQAEYDTETAHIYIKKQLWPLSSSLAELATSSYKLGYASTKGTVDDIKKAAVAVQQAREELDRNWKEVSRDALHYGGRGNW